MKYADGQVYKFGDKADLGGGMTGIVVTIISEERYSSEFTMEDGKFLGDSIIVKSPKTGLVHFSDQSDSYIQSISRARGCTL